MNMRYENRLSSSDRGYTERWRSESKAFLKQHPFCIGCRALGREVRAVLVDHVIPHKGVQRVFWDRSMWQASCRWHHATVKQRLERSFAEGSVKAADLWLNSAAAVSLSKRRPAPVTIGHDGWPS